LFKERIGISMCAMCENMPSFIDYIEEQYG